MFVVDIIKNQHLVEAYSVYKNKGIKFNVVDYRDSETRMLHRSVCDNPACDD